MDTRLPKIVNSPEFLGAVMAKAAGVSPELLTPEEYPAAANAIWHGMNDYLQKEAGFTEENVISFTIGLAMTNPDFKQEFSKQADFMGHSIVTDVIKPLGEKIKGSVNSLPADSKIRGAITGAFGGYQHPEVVNGLSGIADSASGVWNNYIKPFWNAHKQDIINAGIGGLIGAGGNLLMGGNSPISSGLVGAAGGYLAGPSIAKAYNSLTSPKPATDTQQSPLDKTQPTPQVDNSLKQKSIVEDTQNTARQNLSNAVSAH